MHNIKCFYNQMQEFKFGNMHILLSESELYCNQIEREREREQKR